MAKTRSIEQPTLDGQGDSYAAVPGVARSHDTSKPRSFSATLDVAGGPVRFFILQPEQVVTTRLRLIDRCGWTAADKITLPDREAPDYQAKRDVLVHLLQICCRMPEGRPGLMFPGSDGFQRLSLIDDGRLVQLARQVVEFGAFFTPMPPASE